MLNLSENKIDVQGLVSIAEALVSLFEGCMTRLGTFTEPIPSTEVQLDTRDP